MNLKRLKLAFCLILSVLLSVSARSIQYEQITSSCTLATAADIHIQATERAIVSEATVNLTSEDAWLFFDNVRPNDVAEHYAANIQVDGEPLIINKNARVALYEQGTVVIPHPHDYHPLKVYTDTGFEGNAATFACNYYYSAKPPVNAPDSLCRPLLLDNTIHSLKLKRGYMATLACEPDGMGYSRIYIADTHDLELNTLPSELDGKISYIRVMRWQYPSKKGWVGSYWKEMVKGLQYVEEQCDKTHSTWFYNWGSTATSTRNPDTEHLYLNQEFVPMKWGAGGSWSKLYALEDVTHLLGYNEPDHTEQSNVSVERAIEEWPLMQQTGLRLGSPATTDFAWLYNFMNEANRRNYRVDYVAIHAYWGGLSPHEWYTRLREIHERTKRPLWITEWNNGANWTKESWPSGTEKQQQKQLNDIKGILQVMDTCSFVERYSIYNWVEEKRYILKPNGTLTPAGEYYKDDAPDYFFNRNHEVIPTWKAQQAPLLSYGGYTDDEHIILHCNDVNGEQITNYLLEESRDGGYHYTIVDTISPITTSFEVPLNISNSDTTLGITYRIVAQALDGIKLTSPNIKVTIVPHKHSETIATELLITEHWAPIILNDAFANPPAVLTGIPTYRNKMPLSLRIRNIKPNAFDTKLHAWEYQEHPVLANPDTMACLILPHGRHIWSGVTIEVGETQMNGPSTTEVRFSTPFEETPVVIANQVTDHDEATTAVRVYDITREGFKIKLQYEAKHFPIEQTETVHYMAASIGTGLWEDMEIRVGRTPDHAVTDNLDGGYTIHYGTSYTNLPHVYGAMQTMHDSITSTLRLKNRTTSSATIIKDREKSDSHTRVAAEQVGWIIMGHLAKDNSIAADSYQGTSSIAYTLSGQPIHHANKEAHRVYLEKSSILKDKDTRKKLITLK